MVGIATAQELPLDHLDYQIGDLGARRQKELVGNSDGDLDDVAWPNCPAYASLNAGALQLVWSRANRIDHLASLNQRCGAVLYDDHVRFGLVSFDSAALLPVRDRENVVPAIGLVRDPSRGNTFGPKGDDRGLANCGSRGNNKRKGQ